jgi:hypothetical protein
MTGRKKVRAAKVRWPFCCARCGAWTTSGIRVNRGKGWTCLRCDQAIRSERQQQETP